MGSKWKEKIKDLKLSRKMILVHLMVAGVTCILSMASLQLSLRIYDRQLYEKSQQELDFFAQQVNVQLNEIEELSMSIALNDEIQEQLRKMKDMKYLSTEFSYERQQLRRMLLNQSISNSRINNVMYTDGRQVKMIVGMECGVIKDEVYQSMLQDCHDAIGGYVMYNPTKDYPYLLAGRDILETKNARLDYMGTLLFTVDVAGLLEKRADDLAAEHSSLFVYSESGMIYQEEEMKDLDLPPLEDRKGYRIIGYQGRKTFMCYEKSPVTGWMYVNIFPYSEIFGQVMMVRYLLFGGFVAVFFLTVLAMRKIARVITNPLEQLTESMKVVETGDFKGAKEILPVKTSRDEAGILTQEFRTMLDQIDSLIHENYEKQLLLKDTKYKMLQAQINPHFLYNTLNALNWMIRAGKDKDASKMIMELGKLLRASFAKDPYATVEEEVQAARSYITIQQFRYKNRAEFRIRSEGNLEHYMVPRMILQPLIENSIYYGVEKTLNVCQVSVLVKEERDTVYIEVADEGPGMTAVELEQVRTLTMVPKGHGIGLKNIRERLKLAYEDSEFQIYSEPGRGTRIEIRIPKTGKEPGNV